DVALPRGAARSAGARPGAPGLVAAGPTRGRRRRYDRAASRAGLRRRAGSRRARGVPHRMTYDLHRHLWPEPLLAALRERAEVPRLEGWTLHLADGAYPIQPDGYGPERCLAELDRDGIDVALVSLPPTFGFELLPSEEAEALVAAYHKGVLDAVAG